MMSEMGKPQEGLVDVIGEWSSPERLKREACESFELMGDSTKRRRLGAVSNTSTTWPRSPAPHRPRAASGAGADALLDPEAKWAEHEEYADSWSEDWFELSSDSEPDSS